MGINDGQMNRVVQFAKGKGALMGCQPNKNLSSGIVFYI